MEVLDISPETITLLGSQLIDSTLPISKRMRCIFTLRNLAGKDSIEALAKGFGDSSVLLKHEVAYVLGQMRDPYSIPYLNIVLKNTSEDAMVRHEAAEALGAIGDPISIEILQQFQEDAALEVAETCQIALDRIRWAQENKTKDADNLSLYSTVDPAPSERTILSIEELKRRLLDTNLSLFKRYRALFSLRDRGDTESALAMAEGFKDESALFRHEIAYVLGQMQNPATSEALTRVLQNSSESPMVRHEAAEALGAIASNDNLPTLQKFAEDDEDVVRESCEVALDISEYFSTEQFQYADGVSK